MRNRWTNGCLSREEGKRKKNHITLFGAMEQNLSFLCSRLSVVNIKGKDVFKKGFFLSLFLLFMIPNLRFSNAREQ